MEQVWSLWEMFGVLGVGVILMYIPTAIAYMKAKAKDKDDLKWAKRKAALRESQSLEAKVEEMGLMNG